LHSFVIVIFGAVFQLSLILLGFYISFINRSFINQNMTI